MAKTLWISRCLGALLVAGLVTAPFGCAQVDNAIPQTVADALHQMSDEAAIVFVGEVIAVRPHEAGTRASGFIEVDFRVEQAIRGCTTGGNYTLREWAGLWAGNAHRYEAGQRLLMMLRAPGPSGMSSPVGGMDGAIPIRGGGAASLLLSASTTSQTPIADLRWLGAKLLHPVSYPLRAPIPPTPLSLSQQMSPASIDELIADPTTAEGVSANRASIPVQQASVDTVVKLLTSWQKAAHDDVR